MKRFLSFKKCKLLIDKKPLIMGILNITPDSFSDGGSFFNVETAINHAECLIKSGADIIDIGGESTRPFSVEISLEEEISRIIPIIKILAQNFSVPISVDTSKAEVADRALKLGASIINDISSMSLDPDMIKIISKHNAGVILMHMKNTPKNMQLNLFYDNLLNEISYFFSDSIKKAIEAGIDKSSIILDPGIGFSKNTCHNLCILKNLHKFKKFGLPIMVAPSRKAFIKKTINNDFVNFNNFYSMSSFIEIGTQAAVSSSIIFGADIVRVHNVLNTYATIKFLNGIKNA